jgi:DNA topoisomerase-1
VIEPEGADFRLLASGTVVIEPGWQALPMAPTTKREADQLPALADGQVLNLKEVSIDKGRTKAPSRFTTKSFLKYLERRGIGRPSTYNSLFSTLLERAYIKIERSKLMPDEMGYVADELCRCGFSTLFHEKYTALTEESLDKIASGKLKRFDFLRGFYKAFVEMEAAAAPLFEDWAKAHPERDKQVKVIHDEPCPECGAQLFVKAGKHGRFVRCTSAECEYSRSLEELKKLRQKCPDCGGVIVEQPYVKDGKKKVFYKCRGCEWKSSYKPPKLSKYDCHVDEKHGKMLEVTYKKEGKTNKFFQCKTCEYKTWTGPKAPDCPKCKKPMTLRKSKTGEFWGCSDYPECKGAREVRE